MPRDEPTVGAWSPVRSPFRISPTMPVDPRVIIIGAGLAGMARVCLGSVLGVPAATFSPPGRCAPWRHAAEAIPADFKAVRRGVCMTELRRWHAIVVAVTALVCGGESVGRVGRSFVRISTQALCRRGDAECPVDAGQVLFTGSLGTTDEGRSRALVPACGGSGACIGAARFGHAVRAGARRDAGFARGLLWYSLASRQDSGRASLRRDALSAMLTPDQREAIAARPQGWRPRK